MISTLNFGKILLAVCTHLVVFINKVDGQYLLSVRDITVLPEPNDTMMRDYLTHIIDGQFAYRDSLLSTLHTDKDWDRRAQTIQDSMISWTGPFPDRTPLNAQITGRLEREDYIIEKVLFESRPHFLVSANIYIPRNFQFPRPAVLYVIGHSSVGKVSGGVQTICASLAKKGIIAMAIDCIGQGERLIEEYASVGKAPGNAHRVVGTQAFISGTHVFNFMVWDAIRAVDYLVSRPEVDSDNIGITGASGGGMMSTYILPFEDRIKVSIPTCNPNTWSYRVHAGLKTDMEQVFFGAFASAIDPRGDPLFAHVPKPLLINASSDDHLNPPRGVWELATWLNEAYVAQGATEKFTTTMVLGRHGYSREQRDISYSWFLRWLDGNTAGFWEEEVTLEKKEDLWVTNTGNVYDVPGCRMPQELVLDYLNGHKAKWKQVETQRDLNDHKVEMPGLVKEILHTSFDNIEVKAEWKESKPIGQVMVRSFILKPEVGIILPGILLESRDKSQPGKGTVLYISQKGKSNILKDMDKVEDLLASGYSVYAIDLRGIGETAPDMIDKFWDLLAGKPIFGQRVRDILSIVKWIKGTEVNAENIIFWGQGMGALYGAFAGVLTEDISSFLLEEPLMSFESLVRIKVPRYRNEIILPGILEKFDVPQIYQALCPRPVMLLNPYLGNKTRAGAEAMEKVYHSVSMTYKMMNCQNDWAVKNRSGKGRNERILDFFNKP